MAELIAKTCPACGAAFECGVQTGQCWCMELPALSIEAQEKEEDCFCPSCLKERLSRRSG